MKWILFAVVLRCCLCEIAYKPKNKETFELEVEPVKYGEDEYFLRIGASTIVNCKGPRNQKLDWYSPSGQLVTHQASERVHVQDPAVASYNKFTPRPLALTFTDAALEDSGEWQCRAGGKQKSVNLCVLDPVMIELRETEFSVETGRSITLACPVRGEPEPRVRWYKDHEEIISDDSNSTKYKVMMNYKNQGMEALLTIVSLEPADAGNYSCTATNENPLAESCLSDDSANITLNVNYGPILDTKKQELTFYAVENEEIELPCKAQAFPPASYRWFHVTRRNLFSEIDQDLLRHPNDDEVDLILVAEKTVFGEKYRCQVSNQYWQSYIEYTIKKLEKPTPPDEITVSSTEGSLRFNLTWYEDTQKVDSIDVQYFKAAPGALKESYWRRIKVVGFPIEDVDSEGNIITLSDLDEETNYWARFRAVNRAGESRWSTAIRAATSAIEEATETPTAGPEAEEIRPVHCTPTTDKGLLYGIVLTVAIVAIGGACILVVKRL